MYMKITYKNYKHKNNLKTMSKLLMFSVNYLFITFAHFSVFLVNKFYVFSFFFSILTLVNYMCSNLLMKI